MPTIPEERLPTTDYANANREVSLPRGGILQGNATTGHLCWALVRIVPVSGKHWEATVSELVLPSHRKTGLLQELTVQVKLY